MKLRYPLLPLVALLCLAIQIPSQPISAQDVPDQRSLISISSTFTCRQ
jgi:hypothetical protein